MKRIKKNEAGNVIFLNIEKVRTLNKIFEKMSAYFGKFNVKFMEI